MNNTALDMMPFGFGPGINFGIHFLQTFFGFALLCLIVVVIYKLGKNLYDDRRAEAESVASHKRQAYRFAQNAQEYGGKVITSKDLAELEQDLHDFSQKQHKETYSRWESRMNQKFIYESAFNNSENTGEKEVATRQDKDSAIALISNLMKSSRIPFKMGSTCICQIEKAKYCTEIGNILIKANAIG